MMQALVRQHPAEVVQPSEARVLQQVVVSETQVQRRGHRPDRDDEQTEEPRQQEKERRLVLLLCRRPAGSQLA
jgi:hypothetical protein